MADQQTHADSLRYYLGGATSDGGAQTDPDASLGDFRSSTEAVEVDFSVSNPISGISVDFVAGDNALGAGFLTAVGVDALTWEAPGGTAGVAVTILNGETKIIEDIDLNQFIRVSRSSAAALTGTATVTVIEKLENLFAFDIVDATEQAAGVTRFRGFFVRNESLAAIANLGFRYDELGTQQTSDVTQLGASGAGTIETAGSFADWPAQGFVKIVTSGIVEREIVYYGSRTATILTVAANGRGLALGDENAAAAGAASDTVHAVPGYSVAIEAPSSQPSGNIQVIADDITPPTALTFKLPITDVDAVVVGGLSASNIHGVWQKSVFPPGATASLAYFNRLRALFDAA